MIKKVKLEEFQDYVVFSDGRVYSELQNRFLSGSVNPDGYHNFRLKRRDGATLTIGRHRLLAMAFIDCPGKFEDYVVNHKNLVKGDDRLENLEWVTEWDNFRHAGELNANPKFIPIQVRDYDTKEVKYYPCMIECARDIGLSKDQVQYRVGLKGDIILFDRKQYRVSSADKPWNEDPASMAVLVRNVITGKVSAFEKMTDVASALDISPASVTTWIRRDQPVIKGFFQIKFESDRTPWREVEDPVLELAKHDNTRPVKAYNPETKDLKRFSSAKSCALEMRIGVTTLSERLKSNGTKTYSDGYQYSYIGPQ